MSQDVQKWVTEKTGHYAQFCCNSFAAKVLLIVNKIILFWFLFFNSGRYNNKKTGDYQEQRRMGLRMFGPKLFLTPHICEIFFLLSCYLFSFPFPFPIGQLEYYAQDHVDQAKELVDDATQWNRVSEAHDIHPEEGGTNPRANVA